MNLFETVKASVSVPEAARAYGLTVTRHNMTRCLFHDDRYPSLKLNSDFYYCFGCSAKGDVIEAVCPKQIETRSIVIDGDSGAVIKQLL